jgi:hypothetical protein
MRKIIQIVDTPETCCSKGCITALCDDGTIWFFESGKWALFEDPIPQGPLGFHTKKK